MGSTRADTVGRLFAADSTASDCLLQCVDVLVSWPCLHPARRAAALSRSSGSAAIVRFQSPEPPSLLFFYTACSSGNTRRSPSIAVVRMLHRPRPNLPKIPPRPDLPPSATTRFAAGGCNSRDISCLKTSGKIRNSTPPCPADSLFFPGCFCSPVACCCVIDEQVSPARCGTIGPPLRVTQKLAALFSFFAMILHDFVVFDHSDGRRWGGSVKKMSLALLGRSLPTSSLSREVLATPGGVFLVVMTRLRSSGVIVPAPKHKAKSTETQSRGARCATTTPGVSRYSRLSLLAYRGTHAFPYS